MPPVSYIATSLPTTSSFWEAGDSPRRLGAGASVHFLGAGAYVLIGGRGPGMRPVPSPRVSTLGGWRDSLAARPLCGRNPATDGGRLHRSFLARPVGVSVSPTEVPGRAAGLVSNSP